MSVTELKGREAIDRIHAENGTGPEVVPSRGLLESTEPEWQDVPEDVPAEPVPPLDEIVVTGSKQLSVFSLGGKAPDSSTLKFTGGKVDLADGTAYSKGETIVVRVVAVVNEVGQKDTHDVQTGQVVSCEQRHSARITDMVIEG